MPRQKNDAFEALFDELQDQDFLDDLVAGEEDFLSVEEDLPDFKPTPLNFTEWVNAYSPALVEGGLIWDDDSRALAEAIEYGFTHSRVRQAIASHSRSGKTMLLQLGISWFMAKHNLPVVWATASGRLAEANIKAVIQIWQAAKIPLHPKMRSSYAVALGYKASASSSLRAVTVNASLLGISAAVVVLDDACGQSVWLEQETYREKLWRFYSVDLSSRLTKYGNKPSQNMIVVNQRLASAQGDLLDMIMQSSRGAAKAGYKDSWRVLELPIRHPSEEEWHNQDHYSRYPEHWHVDTIPPRGRYGEPTSTRMTTADIVQKEFETPPADFAAMFLCRPDDGENEFWSASWINQVPKASLACDCVVVTVDPSLVGGKKNDRTGVCAIGIVSPSSNHRGKIAILDAQAWDCPAHQLAERVDTYCRKWEPSILQIEATAAGPALLRAARESSLGWYGVSIEGYRPMGKGKAERLAAVVPYFSKGMVLSPEFAPWMMQLNTEMARIARGGRGHDDMADAVIAGVSKVAAMKRSGFTFTAVEWGRGSHFTERGGGTATWGYGTSAVGSGEGRYETDASRSFPGKAIWE